MISMPRVEDASTDEMVESGGESRRGGGMNRSERERRENKLLFVFTIGGAPVRGFIRFY